TEAKESPTIPTTTAASGKTVVALRRFIAAPPSSTSAEPHKGDREEQRGQRKQNQGERAVARPHPALALIAPLGVHDQLRRHRAPPPSRSTKRRVKIRNR